LSFHLKDVISSEARNLSDGTFRKDRISPCGRNDIRTAGASPINILILSPYLVAPDAPGGIRRICSLARFLSARHRVCIVCLAEADELGRVARTEELRPYCAAIEVVPMPPRTPGRRLGTHLTTLPDAVRYYFSDRAMGVVRTVVDDNSIDLVHTEFLSMAPYASMLRSAERVTVLLEQEVPSRRLRARVRARPLSPKSLLAAFQLLKYRRYERRLFDIFDHVFVTTAQEREALPAGPPGREVGLYPNVVDTEYFRPSPDLREEPGTLLFTANFRHRPNVDGLRWYAEAVAPALRRRSPGAKLTVIGEAPPDEVRALACRAGITLAGRQEDLRPCLAGASVFICPMISGGGMRGKVLEAMAMERPVVTTRIGAEGIEATPGREIVLADSPDRFAEEISELLDSDERRRTIGARARRLVAERYSEEVVFSALEALYITYTSRP